MKIHERAYPFLWLAFYITLLISAISFADALDDYASGQTHVNWSRATMPLNTFLVLAILVVIALFYKRYTEYVAGLVRVSKDAVHNNDDNDNDDDNANNKDVNSLTINRDNYRRWVMTQAVESGVDLAFLILALVQVFLIQHFLEYATPNVVVVFLPLYIGLQSMVVILIIGAVRTCGERRSESSVTPFVAALCFLMPCMRKQTRYLEKNAEDTRVERNTRGAAQVLTNYEARAEFQEDPRVYVCVPEAIPRDHLEEQGETVFGWLRLVLWIVALSLVLVHASQVSALERPLAKQLEHCDDLPEICAAIALAIFVMPTDSDTLYQRFGVINGRLLHSLTTWREARVLPLAVAFLPLFFALVLSFFMVIPTAVGYWRQRKNVWGWLSLIARIVVYVFVLLFLALLAAHVDESVLEGRNWHTTLAPAYCAIIVLIGVSIVRLIRIQPKRKSPVISRWGLVVYRAST
jgi:hypothetical protein